MSDTPKIRKLSKESFIALMQSTALRSRSRSRQASSSSSAARTSRRRQRTPCSRRGSLRLSGGSASSSAPFPITGGAPCSPRSWCSPATLSMSAISSGWRWHTSRRGMPRSRDSTRGSSSCARAGGVIAAPAVQMSIGLYPHGGGIRDIVINAVFAAVKCTSAIVQAVRARGGI